MPPPPVAAGWGQPPPPSGGPQLTRSLSVGDVIEAMFRLLRETFVPVASVAAVLLVPGFVLVAIGFTQLGDFTTMFDPNTAVPVEPDIDVPDPSFFVLMGLGSLLSIVGSAAAVPAIMRVGVDHWNGVAPRVTTALATGFRRMWGIISVWLTFIVVLVVVAALPAVLALLAADGLALLYILVVPALLFAVPVSIMVGYLVPATVVAEDVGAWRGLGRVRALLRGNFWPTFGRGLLIGLLLGIVNSVLGFAGSFFGFLPPEVVLVLIVVTNVVSYVVMTPLGNYGGLALYGDLRIRAEGADVLAMVSRLKG